MLTIRKYEEKDAQATWKLFFNTVRNINSQDYNQQQLQAWAPDSMDLFIWNKRMRDIEPFIAEVDGIIVGYADLQNDGLIDHFFCHHNYQRQGVGRALMLHLLHEGVNSVFIRYLEAVSAPMPEIILIVGFQDVIKFVVYGSSNVINIPIRR